MNFELKYKLTKPLYAVKDKRAFRDSEIKLLFTEVDNRCPSCNKSLHWDYTSVINSKHNQIAHIYGRRNFSAVTHDGVNKFHIKDINVIDNYENLIILCDTCHKKYDKSPNYTDYKKYVSLKKILFQRLDVITLVNNALQYIVELYNDDDLFLDLKNLLTTTHKTKYIKTKLKKKLAHNKVSIAYQKDILNDVKYYYIGIKDYFLDDEKFEKIQSEYNSVYKSLKAKHSSDEIINLLVKSLINSSNETEYYHVYRTIVSFFVMNCEVLENVVT